MFSPKKASTRLFANQLRILLRFGDRRDPIKHFGKHHFAFGVRPSSKVESDVLPGITRLAIQAEGRGRLITAVGHTIFAAGIFRDAINNAVAIPINVSEHFSVGWVMDLAIGQEIARRLPTHYVASGNSPSRAGQIPIAGEKFPINRGSEETEAFAPGLGLRKLLDRGS